MALYEFKLPDIGEGVTEGEIVNWLVAVGDQVKEDQEMVEVMTDKATVTIGSPKAGKISELRGAVGDVVPVGAVLVVYDLDGAGGASSPAEKPPAEPAAAEDKKSDEGPVASAVGDIKETLPGMGGGAAKPAPAPAAAQAAPASSYYNERPLAAPATRKLAREKGIDLRKVPPTGPAGRVTREDVERFNAGAASAPAAAASTGSAAAAAAAPASSAATPARAPISIAPVQTNDPRLADERVPVRGVRKRIFENMARSKHTAAHFTYVDEVVADELIALRGRLKPLAEQSGVKLTYLPFIVKACVSALKKHPALNCVFDESTNEMVLRKVYDIGIAAATDAGLMVPVLRGADRLSILEIARELDRLGNDARAGKLKQEDFGGSSFTITSLGKAGGLFATPVINYPEVAILGVHEMKKKPVIRGEEIVIGHEMLLSLSFDHRIIDGHIGAAFAADIVALLQNPDRLMLEMG
ncbi:MAG: dihydrolipoamide acetyltransferase family protein [Polyangiaceae bacterium]